MLRASARSWVSVMPSRGHGAQIDGPRIRRPSLADRCAPAPAAVPPNESRARPLAPRRPRASTRADSSGARSSSCSCRRSAVSGDRSSWAASEMKARWVAKAACSRASSRLSSATSGSISRGKLARCQGPQAAHVAPLHLGGHIAQRQQTAAHDPRDSRDHDGQQQYQRYHNPLRGGARQLFAHAHAAGQSESRRPPSAGRKPATARRAMTNPRSREPSG